MTGDVEVRTVEIKRTEINRTERLRNYTHVHAHVLYKSDFWQRNRMQRQPREARPDGQRAADESCSLPACSLHARTFVVSSSSLIFRRLGGGVAVGHPPRERDHPSNMNEAQRRATSPEALVAMQHHAAAQGLKDEPGHGLRHGLKKQKTRILSFVFSGTTSYGPQLQAPILLPELEEVEEPAKPARRFVPKKKPKPAEPDPHAEAAAKEAVRREAEEQRTAAAAAAAAAEAAAAAAAEEKARRKAATKALAEELEEVALAQLMQQLAAEVLEEEMARRAREEEARHAAEQAAKEAAAARTAIKEPSPTKPKKKKKSPRRASPSHQLLSGERAGPSWSHKQQVRAATWEWSPDERAQATRGGSGRGGTAMMRGSPTASLSHQRAGSSGGDDSGAGPARTRQRSPQQPGIEKLAPPEAIPLYVGPMASPRMAEVRGLSALPACRSGGRDEWLNEQIEKLLKRGFGAHGAIDGGMFSESDLDSDSGGEHARQQQQQMVRRRAAANATYPAAHVHTRAPPPKASPTSSPHALPPKSPPKPSGAPSTGSSPIMAMSPASPPARLVQGKASPAPTSAPTPTAAADQHASANGPPASAKGSPVVKKPSGASSPADTDSSPRRGLFGFGSHRKSKPSPESYPGSPPDGTLEETAKTSTAMTSPMPSKASTPTPSPSVPAMPSSTPLMQVARGSEAKEGSQPGGLGGGPKSSGSVARVSSPGPGPGLGTAHTPMPEEEAVASSSPATPAGGLPTTTAQEPPPPTTLSPLRSELWSAGMEGAPLEEAVGALIQQGETDRTVAASSMARLVALCTESRPERHSRHRSPRPGIGSNRAGMEPALPCLEAMGGGRAGVESFGVLVRVMRAHLDAPSAAAVSGASEDGAEAPIGVHDIAFTLLRRLCAHEERRGQAAEAGAIGAVLSAMRAHPKDASLQAGGCRTLLSLCAGQATVAAAASPRAVLDVDAEARVAGDEGRCMLAAEAGVLDVLASVLETYGPPKDPATAPEGDKRERALRRSAMKHAVLCVLALTYGSVIRAHWAVQAGVVTALSTAARRARMPGAQPLPFADKIDLARQWLEMQARLLGPRSIMRDVVPRNSSNERAGRGGRTAIDAPPALIACLPSWLQVAAGKCVRGVGKGVIVDGL